jgi:predicted SprT family Zn-dependent metalloprotease
MRGIGKNSPNQQYVTLSAAFDFFNRRLFAGCLPHCLITLQRHKGTYGYYSPRRFEARGGERETDEIALNPGEFKGRSDTDILSTLVHEMVHSWQEHHGKPSRRTYHNHEWAAKMQAVGLMPSDTGEPGGAKVGQKMTHYVIAGGPFERACKELLRGVCLEWQSRENDPKEREKKNRSKTKYTCPECGVNAWAKPRVSLVCGECGVQLEPEETEDG